MTLLYLSRVKRSSRQCSNFFIGHRILLQNGTDGFLPVLFDKTIEHLLCVEMREHRFLLHYGLHGFLAALLRLLAFCATIVIRIRAVVFVWLSLLFL